MSYNLIEKELSSYKNGYEYNGDVVISGLSGRLPNGKNIHEWSKQLYPGKFNGETVGEWCNYVNDEEKYSYDWSKFGGHPTDPFMVKLAQIVWEAVVDAGLKPYELKNKRVGFAFGIGKWTEHADAKYFRYNEDGMTTMPIEKYAWELVKYFGLAGPVKVFEATEATAPQGFIALDYGYDAIRSDLCDIVIVAGVSNKDTYGKVDGVFIVEKMPIEPVKYYAKIVDSKVKFDALRDAMTAQDTKPFGDPIGHAKFLHDFYTYGQADANKVDYLETNWSWPVRKRESGWQPDYYAIGDVFAKVRTTTTPFQMGTTKWMNAGEYAVDNGVYSLFKMLMSMKMGIIPAHVQHKLFEKPKYWKGAYEVNEDDYYINNNHEGRLWAFSSYGRSLVHVVLEPFKYNVAYVEPTPTPTAETDDEYTDELPNKPKFATISGQTKQTIEEWFKRFYKYNVQYDQTLKSPQHPYRGYAIYSEDSDSITTMKITKTPYTEAKRPIWFAFTGMPSHWHGEISKMMEITPFRQSIDSSAAFLKKHYSVDVYKWIYQDDIEAYSEKDKLFYTYLMVPIMQIAFVHLFDDLFIRPDYTVGYGCGEIVAAYAQKVLTFEEAVKAIYLKSKMLYDEYDSYKNLKWKTATVGLPYKQFVKYTSDKYPSVHVTHYNTSDSITIGGPEEQFYKLIKELQFNGVYVKEFQTNGVPMNTHYMEAKSVEYKKKLDEFMGKRLGSTYKEWYPTSMKPESKTTPAEYFAGNMSRQVNFHDVLDKIHDHAIVIEIGPTFEFLKQFLKKKSDWIKCYSFMKMDEHHGYFDLVLNSLGELYNEGLEIDWVKLWSYKPKRSLVNPERLKADFKPQYTYTLESKDEKDDKWIKYYETGAKSYDEPKMVMPSGAGMDEKFMLESVKFVPYNEQRVYEHITESNSEAEKLKKSFHEHFGYYIDEIKHYLGKLVAEKYKNDKRYQQSARWFTMPHSEEWSGKQQYGGKFLDYVKSLFKSQIELSDEKFDKLAFYKYWNEDKYLNYYHNMYLKSVMDTVYENLDDQKTFKVLEVAPMMNWFGKKLYEQSKYPVKFEYYYAPMGKYFDTKLWNEMKKDSVYPMTLINDWCYDGGRIQFPMHKYKDFDLVIFNGGFSMFNDAKMVGKWLHEVKEQMLKPSGFVLAHEYKSDLAKYFKHLFYGMPSVPYGHGYGHDQDEMDLEWTKLFDSDYFHQISYKVDPKLSKFYLYRKPFTSSLYDEAKMKAKNDWEIYLTDDDHNEDMQKWYGKIKYALNECKYERVWLISEKTDSYGVMGMVKHIRDYEPNGKRLRCVFLIGEQAKQLWSYGYEDVKRGDLVWNVYTYETYGSYKHFPYDVSTFEPQTNWLQNGFEIQKLQAYKQWPAKGWSSATDDFKETKNFVKVSYASLNPYEWDENVSLECAWSKMDTCKMDMEFSGVLHQAGSVKRVMGIKPVQYMTTGVDADWKYLWELPEKWTFEDAATVPYSYATAYYGLVKVGDLKKGQKVLIMDGATPIGQAAIAIALRKECYVYVFVRNESEAYYLSQTFPKLSVGDNVIVFHTKPSQYGKTMKQASQGVDLVFAKTNEWDAFPSEHYVYWYKPTEAARKAVPYNKRVSYANVSELFGDEEHGVTNHIKRAVWKQIHEWIKFGLESDFIKPFKYDVHPKEQFADEYGCIMKRHALYPMQKALVKLWEPKGWTAKPAAHFYENETYVFINGTTTKFSLYLAQWLSKHGAKQFLFTYPAGKPKFTMSKDEIEQFESVYDVTVKFVQYDAKNYKEVLMKATNPFATKVAGVFYFYDKYDTESMEQMPYQLWLEKNYKDIENLYNYAFETVVAKHFVVFTPFHTTGHYLKPAVGSDELYYAKDNFYSTYTAWSELVKLMGLSYTPDKMATVVQASFIYEWLDSAYTKKQYAIESDKWEKVYDFLEHVLFKNEISKVWSINWTAGTGSEFFGSWKKAVEDEYEYKSKQWYDDGSKYLYKPYEDEPKGAKYSYKSYEDELKCAKYLYKSYEEQKKSYEQTKYREFDYSVKPSQSKYGFYDYEEPVVVEAKAKYSYLMPKSVIEKLNDVESKYLTPVFIIHPIEGHAGMLKRFAQYVKYPVYGVQFTKEAIAFDSIEELADFYTMAIMRELKKWDLTSTSVHLCGYGYGAQVAFQMTRSRDAKKFFQIVSLSLLDGSYKYPTKFECPATGAQMKLDYQIEWLKEFYKQYAPEKYMPDTMTLKYFDDEKRYDAIVESILKYSKFNFEPVDLKFAVKAYVKKMEMACFYAPRDGLKFDKVLMVKPEYKKEKFDESLWFLPSQNRDKYEWKTVKCYDREFLDSTYGQDVAQYLNEFFKFFW